ncbi:hypothetical protein J502_0782 [Acinetobacter sp. 1294596]|nr:hypothetical protein ACINWCA157_1550 [Acinetobacter radioresistens WC-A-157]EXF58085.1 hypothetical protein J502_0782 [Acinetobacter sp. 1294596]
MPQLLKIEQKISVTIVEVLLQLLFKTKNRLHALNLYKAHIA